MENKNHIQMRGKKDFMWNFLIQTFDEVITDN